jgi:hypothetical protein
MDYDLSMLTAERTATSKGRETGVKLHGPQRGFDVYARERTLHHLAVIDEPVPCEQLRRLRPSDP